MHRYANRRAVAVVAIGVLGIGGCSAEGGNEAPPAAADRGPITLATGKDTTGTMQAQLDRWNAEHPNEKVTLVELPESADQQRQQFIQNARTKSDAYTVVNLDVVWVAEFAANRWIDELPAGKVPVDKMIPAVVDTAKYFNKLYAVPYTTNGGLLFYRKDLLDAAGAAAPTTWAQLKDACAKVKALPEGKDLSCYAGQFDKYEGLTVNFAEAVDSAGGAIVDANGKPTVNTSEAKQGLGFLADSFKDGTIAKSAISFKEEDGRREFQAGKLIFHRQWPYEWDLANKTDGSSKVAGKFAVAPLPGLSGPGKSSLGGLDLAISAFGKHKATALDFISFFAGEDNARKNLEATSNAPAYASLYQDTGLQQKYPYLDTLRQSILNAAPRPKVVAYGDVTAVIQENAYAAITGTKPVDTALADMQAGLDKAVATK
ncbi:ABC transporter substrate-binding protein [Dactylosporangium sp. NPDC000244]|uniref:ABC transporter substrate-binding protein n=1 Tax=Dactylosporangium sp. NPDC000244 TaxID=3154365 RepID=UPI00331EF67B